MTLVGAALTDGISIGRVASQAPVEVGHREIGVTADPEKAPASFQGALHQIPITKDLIVSHPQGDARGDEEAAVPIIEDLIGFQFSSGVLRELNPSSFAIIDTVSSDDGIRLLSDQQSGLETNKQKIMKILYKKWGTIDITLYKCKFRSVLLAKHAISLK